MPKTRVEQQDVTEIKGTTSYHEWRERNDHRPEPIEANPDQLSDDHSFFHVSDVDKEVQERVRRLIELAKQVLTEQQYKVFDLLVLQIPHNTQRQVAQKLKISQGRVQQLWERIRAKLQVTYENRTK